MFVVQKKMTSILLWTMLILTGYIWYQSLFIAPYTLVIKGGDANYAALTFGLSIVLVLVFILIYKKLNMLNEKQLKIYTNIMWLIILAGQIIALIYVMKVRFLPITDLASNTNEAILLLDTGSFAEKSTAAIYPFNRTHIILLYFFYSILKAIGITNYWQASLVFSILCMDIAILFAFKSVKLLLNNKAAALLLQICIFMPLTYFCVPYYYTSIISLPFMMSALYYILKVKDESNIKKGIIFGLLVGGISAFGYSIRGTSAFPIIAFVVFIIIKFRVDAVKDKKNKVKFVSIVISFLIISVIWSSVILKYDKYDRADTATPLVHNIMMSLQGQGAYNEKDFKFILSYPTKEEKVQASTQEIVRRLKDMKLPGLLNLIESKIKFTWAEGHSRITNWYGAQAKFITGYKRDLLMIYSQIFRIAAYFLMLISIIGKIVSKKYNGIMIPIIVMFGGFVFHNLIENNPQYSIPFLITIAIVAVDGIETALSIFDNLIISSQVKLIKTARYIVTVAMGVVALVSIEYSRQYTEYVRELEEYSINQGYRNNYLLEVVSSNNVIMQSFKTNKEFNSIKIGIGVANNEIDKELYKFELKDVSGNVLYSQDFGVMDIDSNGNYIEFRFDTIMPDKEQIYFISIASNNQGNEDSLKFAYEDRKLDYSNSGELSLNEVINSEADLTFIVSNVLEDSYFTAKGYFVCCSLIIIAGITLIIMLGRYENKCIEQNEISVHKDFK